MPACDNFQLHLRNRITHLHQCGSAYHRPAQGIKRFYFQSTISDSAATRSSTLLHPLAGNREMVKNRPILPLLLFHDIEISPFLSLKAAALLLPDRKVTGMPLLHFQILPYVLDTVCMFCISFFLQDSNTYRTNFLLLKKHIFFLYLV